ncbi:EI24 domain-containing protein [Actinoplanes sp. NPDC048791]|uniref:EI24 domain-containing protein n=1 Tax=Actinoplanes sp. NPDC048791 TaxID=3154623 RepID=UPI003410DC98
MVEAQRWQEPIRPSAYPSPPWPAPPDPTVQQLIPYAVTEPDVPLAAGIHPGRAARKTVSAVRDFGAGIAIFWRGTAAFGRRPRLWLCALLPALIVSVALWEMRAAVAASARRIAAWATGWSEGWGFLHDALEQLVFWALCGLAEFLVGFVLVPLGILVGAPFCVLLVRWLERGNPPSGPAPPGWFAAVRFCLTQAVLATLVLPVTLVVLTPVLVVPVVNVVLILAVSGFLVGLLAVGLPLHHRGTGNRRDHLRYAWQHRWPVTGFGAMCVTVLAVPLPPLRWLTVPVVLVGAVLLHQRFPIGSGQTVPAAAAPSAMIGGTASPWPADRRWSAGGEPDRGP